MNILWTPTEKDMLEVDAMQTYTRNHITGTPADYVRAYHLQADYTRLLGEKGASILFTLGAENISDNGGNAADASAAPYRNHATYPFMVVEYATPVISENLWLTAGFEGGLSVEKNCVADYTNHSNYQDLYAQLDYTIGNGASWWATDSAPSISVRSRLPQKRTGSIVPTTIAIR